MEVARQGCRLSDRTPPSMVIDARGGRPVRDLVVIHTSRAMLRRPVRQGN